MCGAVGEGAEASSALQYRIQRYVVEGASGISDAEMASQLSRGTGERVSLAGIRAAMVQLRQYLKEQGYPKASVALPRQPLTHGVVTLQVNLGTPAAAKDGQPAPGSAPQELAAWKPSGFDIRHFVVRGNSVLSAEELDAVLAPAAGPAVTPQQLEAVLRRLKQAYRDKGYVGAVVSLPQQLLTDGTVAIVVQEGATPSPNDTAQRVEFEPGPVVPQAPSGPFFEVRRFEVAGNTLIPPDALDTYFTNALGPKVSLGQIQKALGNLQLGYRERGFATVSVGLPQQQLTNGVVRVLVTEGVLTDIRVTGNQHFSSNNVMAALPSLRTNVVLNSQVFQRELDLANQNRDRQIYPTLGPGPDPGTSSLELRVKDRLPLHGRGEVNNYNTPGTPRWRVNTSVQYNNLWQEEHQVGFSYGFSPQEYKDPLPSPDLLLNRPLVSFFSTYYRLPLGAPDSVEQQINSATGFGFNEATRQFVLPPAGARPELIFFASAAPIDTGVQYGPERVVTQTPLLTIVSQDTGQNLTWADDLGGQYTHPWVLSDKTRAGVGAGLDWKRFAQESFNTNNFIITTVVTNAQGSQTIVTRVSSPQPVRRSQVTYLPLNQNGNFSRTDRWGTLSGTVGLSYNVVGDPEQFQMVAGTRNARPEYVKGVVSLNRDQKLPGDWSLLVRGSGQGATVPLIGNEQFSLGGINSVRGYFEGDVFGDSGWFASAELRSPYLNTTLPIWMGEVPAWLRGSIFIDSGQAWLIDRGPAGEAIDRLLWGAGFGMSLNINQYVFLRFALAWPFADTLNTTAGDPRAYVTLEGQF